MKTLRNFEPADRYTYDFGLCSSKNGFAQVDTGQDASYFGIWANPFKFVIFTYCEGDCITNIADNANEFVNEINSIKKWNNENGHAFYGIDPGFNENLKNEFVKLGLSEMLY